MCEEFLDYQQVSDAVAALSRSKPELCRRGSLGVSREGRAIHLLTVTDFSSGSPQDRPGLLIHANIHAVELAGTNAAIYTAKQLLNDHVESDLLKHVTFYIVPRLNPDGAEFA